MVEMVVMVHTRREMSEERIVQKVTEMLPTALSMLKQPPLQFWIDFGNFIKATHEGDDSDKRWEQLCKWADILLSRYNNKLANLVVMQYLNCLGTPDNDTT